MWEKEELEPNDLKKEGTGRSIKMNIKGHLIKWNNINHGQNLKRTFKYTIFLWMKKIFVWLYDSWGIVGRIYSSLLPSASFLVLPSPAELCDTFPRARLRMKSEQRQRQRQSQRQKVTKRQSLPDNVKVLFQKPTPQ